MVKLEWRNPLDIVSHFSNAFHCPVVANYRACFLYMKHIFAKYQTHSFALDYNEPTVLLSPIHLLLTISLCQLILQLPFRL